MLQKNKGFIGPYMSAPPSQWHAGDGNSSSGGAPDVMMFVDAQPCLRGTCRTGHQMDNALAAFIAVALRDRPSFPWRYRHVKSKTRNGNDAMELFALASLVNPQSMRRELT